MQIISVNYNFTFDLSKFYCNSISFKMIELFYNFHLVIYFYDKFYILDLINLFDNFILNLILSQYNNQYNFLNKIINNNFILNLIITILSKYIINVIQEKSYCLDESETVVDIPAKLEKYLSNITFSVGAAIFVDSKGSVEDILKIYLPSLLPVIGKFLIFFIKN